MTLWTGWTSFSPCYRLILCSILLFFGLLGCSSPKKPAAGREKAPVMIITLDTTRADRLGCYGNDRGLTPFLDGFSREAHLFENCETPVPMTLPAHVSLFSGLYPVRTTIQGNLSPRVPREVPLLPEEYRSAGYSTAAFISASVLLSRYGLDRGFDVYDESFYDPRSIEYQRSYAERTLNLAEKWLEGRRAGPFFIWIHLYDPHYPYQPPEPWAGKYKDSPYDGAVAYMDSKLGEFFNKPAMKGWKDWNVLICADHGESLGEHDESTHGVLLYEGATRVPLMVRFPGQTKGSRIANWTSLVDVAPTLRETTSQKAMESDGVSLTPLFAGLKIHDRPLFLESINGTTTYGWAPLFGVVRDGRKFIEAPRSELYDLKKDRSENNNMFGTDKAADEALQAEVRKYKEMTPLGTPGTRQNLSSAEIDQLEGLGYIQAGFSASGVFDRDPKDLVALVDYFQEVTLAFRKKDFREAERILNEVEKKDPYNPYVFYRRAELLEKESKGKAAENYEKAVKLAPAYSLAWSMWIRMLMDEGRLVEAADTARKAMKVCRDDMGYFNLALAEEALFRGKDHGEVRRYIEKTLGVVPEMGRAYMVLFEMAMREGAPDEAKENIDKVWKYTSKEEVFRWHKDPLFKGFFAAAFDMGGITPEERRRKEVEAGQLQ